MFLYEENINQPSPSCLLLLVHGQYLYLYTYNRAKACMGLLVVGQVQSGSGPVLLLLPRIKCEK